MTDSRSHPTLIRGLGPLAASAIVVGVVIGTGVFLKARVMTCNVGTPGLVMAAWIVAGLLSWPAPSPTASSRDDAARGRRKRLHA